MTKKPQDLLEFFRRATAEEPESAPLPEPAAPEPGPTRRMVLVRPTQIAVAGAAAVLLVVLAFLLGLRAGGGAEAAPGTGVWVVRVITYGDTENGRIQARVMAAELERQGLGEVTLQPIESKGHLVVALGAWLQDPRHNADAAALRDRVRAIKDERGGAPFQKADFWRIER